MKIHNYLLPHSNHNTGSYDTQPHHSPVVEDLSVVVCRYSMLVCLDIRLTILTTTATDHNTSLLRTTDLRNYTASARTETVQQ